MWRSELFRQLFEISSEFVPFEFLIGAREFPEPRLTKTAVGWSPTSLQCFDVSDDRRLDARFV